MALSLKAEEKKFNETFPVDEYTNACITEIQLAELPPSKLAKTPDPVPSVRFLFSDGTHRKWTEWMRISYAQKAKLTAMFSAVPMFQELLQDYEPGDPTLGLDDGKLWDYCFKIQLEDDNGYPRIFKVKEGTDKELPSKVFFDPQYLPYKTVKAFGKVIELDTVYVKTSAGVQKLVTDQLADAPANSDD